MHLRSRALAPACVCVCVCERSEIYRSSEQAYSQRFNPFRFDVIAFRILSLVRACKRLRRRMKTSTVFELTSSFGLKFIYVAQPAAIIICIFESFLKHCRHLCCASIALRFDWLEMWLCVNYDHQFERYENGNCLIENSCETRSFGPPIRTAWCRLQMHLHYFLFTVKSLDDRTPKQMLICFQMLSEKR